MTNQTKQKIKRQPVIRQNRSSMNDIKRDPNWHNTIFGKRPPVWERKLK